MLHFFAIHTNRVFDSSRDFPEAIFLRKFMSVVERSIAQKASTAVDLRFVLVSHKCWIHSATTSFKMFSRLFFSTTAAVRCEIISSSYAMVMTRSGLCVAAMFCWFRCGWQLPICFFFVVHAEATDDLAKRALMENMFRLLHSQFLLHSRDIIFVLLISSAATYLCF